MGCPRRSDARHDGAHRLCSGRGRRAAGEPHSVPLFFPEKRPFFLENAQLFQLGQPQAIDLFFSRRIGLSATGQPIDIVAGGRLSGKLGGYNVGLLNMQTDDAVNDRTGQRSPPATISPSCGSSGKWAVEFRRDVREPAGRRAAGGGGRLQPRLWTRSRVAGDDQRQVVRLHGPHGFTAAERWIGLRRPHVLRVCQPVVGRQARLRAGRRPLQPGSRLPAAARLPAGRGSITLELSAEAVAVDPPHPAALQLPAYTDLDNDSTAPGHTCTSSTSFTGQAPVSAIVDMQQDRPTEPFAVYQDVTGGAW